MPSTTLITGATGFVGGQLLDALRAAEVPLRAIVRDASSLAETSGVEVVEGDLADPEAIRRALDGCGLAYYLVHSMEAGADGDFATRDKELAEGFIEAAGELGVGRVVYLTGVVPGGGTSRHLDSRQEVEEVLAGGAPELVSLRASMVVGPDSDSFRTLAQIVDRLPVLALPSWRDTKSQPVGIADVVAALLAAADVAPGVYEIAGPDTLTIEEMVEAIGELNGKVRPASRSRSARAAWRGPPPRSWPTPSGRCSSR